MAKVQKMKSQSDDFLFARQYFLRMSIFITSEENIRYVYSDFYAANQWWIYIDIQ